MIKNSLSQNYCVACRVGEPTLTKEEIEKLKPQLDVKWSVEKKPDKLVRVFEFKDFGKALEFINKVGEIAESEGHHPNIYLFDYKKVKLDLWTHKIVGLHRNDFILASKIDLINFG